MNHPPPAKAPALAGLRIADFSHFVAGPLCSLILGDLGAEIIKIEKRHGGDDLRHIGPALIPGESGPYLWANRNKKSIALDLSTQEGQQIARDIVAKSDVLLENFSTGVMPRLGLDYPTLAARDPRLIYCSISAYGRSGPLADRLGFDPITQAESGFMSMNGEADGPALRTGPAVMDMSTGMMASNAILAALFARERTGEGQFIECVLFDQAVTMTGFHAMNYLMSGREPRRVGNNSRDAVPVWAFDTADDPIYVACANDRTWHRFAIEVLQRPALASDPDYAGAQARVKNREPLIALLNAALRAEPREHWLTRMRDSGVPAGPINTISQAFDGPEIAARGLLSRLPHPTLGVVPNIALPFRFDATPLVEPTAAPTLGQHTHAILREVLGYEPTRIDQLLRDGTVVA